MERRKRIGDRDLFRSIRSQVIDNTWNGIYEWIKDAKYPDNPEEVEYEMGESSPACLRIPGKRCYIGSHGCPDILSHDQRNTQIEIQYPART